MKKQYINKYIYFLSFSLLVFGIITGCKKQGESPISGNVILVNCNARSTVHNGKTWNSAFLSIQEAMDTASGEGLSVTSGGEIWVAKGTYYENLIIHSGILLYGGFQGDENSKDKRDWINNATIIDGSKLGTVIKASSVLLSETRIDGFVIQNGYPNDDGDGGGIIVRYDNQGYFTIKNNTIQYNTSYGFGGIYLGGESLVQNNTIKDNSSLSVWGSKDGSGISCSNCSPNISNNIFSGNNYSNGSALFGDAFRGEFMNNIITGGEGSIIYVHHSSGLFANNLIVNNTEVDRIFIINYSNTKVYNNTISANPNACAFDLSANLSPQIVNNIISGNKSGIENTDDDANSIVIKNNCFFGNTNGNYENTLNVIGNITDNPKLSGDFHLQSGSPCINKGDNSVVLKGWVDMDGGKRINAGQVDIGADEYN